MDWCARILLLILKLTYSHYLRKLADYGVQEGALLEIGCANGFFLEEALAEGYATVCEVSSRALRQWQEPAKRCAHILSATLCGPGCSSQSNLTSSACSKCSITSLIPADCLTSALAR